MVGWGLVSDFRSGWVVVGSDEVDGRWILERVGGKGSRDSVY